MEQAANKIDFIKSNLSGPVLDVGFLGHSAKGFETCPVHTGIFGIDGMKVFGMDLEWAEIREATWYWSIGCHLAGDACYMPIKDNSIGTIVAADLIEHLWNVGLFLDNCRRVLIEGGRLIITTPNPYYIDNWLYVWYRNRVLVNPDHKNLFCPVVLSKMLSYYGFKVECIRSMKSRWNLAAFLTQRKGYRYDHMTGRWLGKPVPGERHLLAVLRAIWWPLRWILTLLSPMTRYSDYGVVCEK